MHWLPRSVGRKRAGKFKHTGIFSHDPVPVPLSLTDLFLAAAAAAADVEEDLVAKLDEEESVRWYRN